jgi:hypothetical protein
MDLEATPREATLGIVTLVLVDFTDPAILRRQCDLITEMTRDDRDAVRELYLEWCHIVAPKDLLPLLGVIPRDTLLKFKFEGSLGSPLSPQTWVAVIEALVLTQRNLTHVTLMTSGAIEENVCRLIDRHPSLTNVDVSTNGI